MTRCLRGWGKGSKVVEINPVTGLVAVVSDGNEPSHVMHSYFETNRSEIAVDLDGSWYVVELGRCLDFDAHWGRDDANPFDAFRLVQGSLNGIPPVELRSIFR